MRVWYFNNLRWDEATVMGDVDGFLRWVEEEPPPPVEVLRQLRGYWRAHAERIERGVQGTLV